MSKTLTDNAAGEEAANYEQVIGQLFSEIERANERMERDQEEIERLKAETREILERLRAA